MSLTQFHKVRETQSPFQTGRWVSSSKPFSLSLPAHRMTLIIKENDLYWKLMSGNRSQLSHIDHDRTIPGYQYHPLSGGVVGSYGSREAIAHRGLVPGMDETLVSLELEGLRHPGYCTAGITADDLARFQYSRKLLDQDVGIHRVGVGTYRVTAFPIVDSPEPFITICAIGEIGIFSQPWLCITADTFPLKTKLLEFPNLGQVDIHHDDSGFGSETGRR